MSVNTDPKRLTEILDRGIVSRILPSREALLGRLTAGDKLRIFIGVDPTGDALHLSHAKNYLFLEELRQLGHEVIVLFGDFTARIGDPTGRASARPQLSAGEVEQNAKNWLKQVRPLLNFDDSDNPPHVLYNSEWLAVLTLEDLTRLAGHFTVQQMIERDMFESRWQKGEPIHLHEFLYPLMQGYDSVAMDVDVELCGTDQIFNALAGRTLLKRLKDKDKLIIALNLMENPKTGELMSKSRGTGVFLNDGPNELYGAIMAQPDEMTELFYINNTRLPLSDKNRIMALGPREAKAIVAKEIVKIIHGEAAAVESENTFNRTFREGEIPEELSEINLSPKGLAETLIKAGIISSKTEWRRLIEEGAVRDKDSFKITDSNFYPEQTIVLKIGKRRFVKIIVKDGNNRK